MTSKNLFIKLLLQDGKRRIWTLALLSLVFFLLLPVVCALGIEDYRDYVEFKYAIESLTELIGPYNQAFYVITIGSAVVCGLSSFFSLHSRKKVDFYHCLPVKREMLFASNYLNGIILYMLPYIICLLMTIGIISMNGYMVSSLWRSAILALGINLVFYILIYTVVIIAVMLTGNLVVSCLGSAVLLFYGPAILGLQRTYLQEFFSTYYTEHRITDLMKIFSPIFIYLDVIERYNSGESIGKTLVLSFGAALVLCLFALFLYKKRPSEAAGYAMAFGSSKPIIKAALVIMVSMAGGLLLRNAVSYHKDGWFLFGLVFTMTVGHAIIEIIYNFDIRSAFKNWKQLLLCAGLTGLIVISYRFDLFRYDSYLPDQDKIESMSVMVSGIDNNFDYFERVDNHMRHTDGTQYHLQYMDILDTATAYRLAQKGVEEVDQQFEHNNMYHYIVKYTLRGGKEVYRSYQLELQDSHAELEELYANKDFREVHNPLNNWSIDDISNIGIRYASNLINNEKYGSDSDDSYNLSLDFEQKKKLMEAYKKELNQITLTELSDTTPVARLNITLDDYSLYNYFVFPSFHETLSLLKEYGFDASQVMDTSKVLRLELQDYRPKQTETIANQVGVTKETAASTVEVIVYDDKDDIDRLLPYLVDSDYIEYNNTLVHSEDYLEVYAYVFSTEYNQELCYRFNFRKGEVPDFVLRDLEEVK